MREWSLSRRGKTIRNVLLTLLLLAGIWLDKGAPLPTAEMEFRRMERENLLPVSQIVYQIDQNRHWLGGNGQTGGHFGGVGRDWAVAAYYRRRGSGCTWGLTVCPLKEGPTPIALPELVERSDEMGQSITGLELVVLQIPQQAAHGEVEVYVNQGMRTEQVLTARGERREGGMICFWFPTSQEDTIERDVGLEAQPYKLVLYREDGTVLLEQEGTIPGSL